MNENKTGITFKDYRKAKKFSLMIKRIFDFICALLGIIILVPLWILLPLIIICDSKGGVIFKQKRLGLNGKEFNIYKFRTMVKNAENIGEGISVSKGDNRITKVGRVFRKTSLDELPQLINILKGDMSFIGPRPPATYHPHKIEEYNSFEIQRFFVKPGISGLAQIKCRNAVGWDEKIIFDVKYVFLRGLFYDFKILVKTFTTLFSGKAY